jgi:maleamate amidohydrolase
MDWVNKIAALCRELHFPVIWTFCAYLESGEDCTLWGTRSNTPDSLQNIKYGSERAKLDPRLVIGERDIVMAKRMASAFFETMVPSLMTFHRIDTVIVTGGSTSGCVRATAVDSLSRSYRTIIPEECVADKHESPHFANLYDLAVKYADVVPAASVESWLMSLKTNQPEMA